MRPGRVLARLRVEAPFPLSTISEQPVTVSLPVNEE